MTPQEEATFERKAEKMLRGQRELPTGRDYRCFTERFRLDINNLEFDKRFDRTFPGAPGSEHSLNMKYCPRCGKLFSWCECE